MRPRIQDYDYPLPPQLVAQYPLPRRDTSRLLVLSRDRREIHHAAFRDLPQWLEKDDLLVVNDTRVFPARLRGVKDSGGKTELLLHHLPEAEEGEERVGGGGQGSETPLQSSPKPPPPTPIRVFPKGAKARATYRGHLKPGQVLKFRPDLQAEVISLLQPGIAEVRFWSLNGDVCRAVLEAGEVPLPPYIRRDPEELDRGRYQTVYASQVGAIAAPTAGLHFTEAVMEDLNGKGIETVSITLHVGPGTFAPVRVQDYTQHRLGPEYFEVSADTASRLNQARAQGKRLTAVGTTSVRVLEHCVGNEGFSAQKGWCDLFIYPGYRFQAVGRLLTNFHLAKSSLLLLVSAFAGRDLVLRAYEEAVKELYRFYSYGDCMLIL
jgi:S-adenosylmethionine:tRNA ribosyltransferase-isomerase